MGKRIGFRKAFLLVLFLCAGLVLFGCSLSEDGVKLASEREVVRYATSRFGDVECVARTEDEHSAVYTLKDKEYGFQYEVESYVERIGMDGSTFGYREQKSSDFKVKYGEYICGKLGGFLNEQQKRLGFEFELDDTNDLSVLPYFGQIMISDGCDAAAVVAFLEDFGRRIAELDDRGFWKSAEIPLYSKGDSERIGAFLFRELRYLTRDELDVVFYMDSAKRELGTDVAYSHSEIMRREDVLGLGEFASVHVIGSDNHEKELVTCYYFSSDGKLFFVSDVFVREDSGHSHHHIYCLTDKESFRR